MRYLPHHPILATLICFGFMSGLQQAVMAQSYTLSTDGDYLIEIDNPEFIFFGGDDSYEIPIGFNFAFFGNVYDHCWIGSDGFIHFGDYPGGGCCGQAIPSTDPVITGGYIDNVIAACWTNMDWHSIHYEVFGDAPYRRLVMTFDYGDPCSISYYGQVKLYETTNVIEIHTQQWADNGAPCQEAVQGIENIDGTEAIVMPERNFNTTWAVHPGDDDVVTFTPNVSFFYSVIENPFPYNLEFVTPTDVTIADNQSLQVGIGFDFQFFGAPFDSCYINQNGYITFSPQSGDGCCEGAFIPASDNVNGLIAANWADMNASTCCSGGGNYDYIAVETLGVEPDRRFIITFYAYEWCSGNNYWGQIKLFEGTNIIEIHSNLWAESNAPCANATQGIENMQGTQAYFASGRNSNTNWQIECCGDVVMFSPSTLLEPVDASVVDITDDPVCGGNHPITAFIQNAGNQAIDFVTVEWEFNGVPQTPVEYTETLLPASAPQSIELGTQLFEFGQDYTVKVWTSMPNGLADPNTVNDTMTATITVGMSGEFTIGGTDPDFDNFADAIAAIGSEGACDTVIFNVRSGVYNEQILLPQLNGVSADHPVIFQSEALDSSEVIVHYSASDFDNNYVLRFNGADHITWQHMTLSAQGTSLAKVIELMDDATDNRIQHCELVGKNTTSQFSDYFIVHSRSNNHRNVFYQNRFNHGSTSFYHEWESGEGGIGGLQGGHPGQRGGGGGNNNAEPLAGNVFLQNQFVDFANRGIRTHNTLGLQIHENTFQTSKNALRVIDIWEEEDTLAISHNIINASAANGIYLRDVVPPGNVLVPVFNNMISIPGATCQAALHLENCHRTKVIHNNIRINTSILGRFGIFVSGGSNDTLYNNVVANVGGGELFGIWSLFSMDFDHNAYYTTGSVFGTYISQRPTFHAWQLATAKDSNSIFTNPLYASATDLHVISSFINGAGTADQSIPVDIDFEERDITLPDIGADEFDPVATDVAILASLSPGIVCIAEQPITIALGNMGGDTLQQVTVQWTVNGVAQPDFLYEQTLLPEGDTAHVTIGVRTFSNQSDTIRIWLTLPNDTTDLQPNNDTIEYIYRLPLQGIYTIGGSTPDFASITEAVTAINDFYTCGPVTFRIRDGVYTEQVFLDSIPTTSAINTITFESESLDSTAVTIQWTPTSSAFPAVITLRGTDYVTFRYLQVKALSSTWSDCIDFRYSACHNTVSHCHLDAYQFGSSGVHIRSLNHGGVNEYLTLEHNYIVNGQHGVYLYNGGPRIRGIVIQHNQFVNQRYNGMDISHLEDLIIRNNQFTTTSNYVSFESIDLSSLIGDGEISGNTIHQISGDGMFLDGMNHGAAYGNVRVFNNMVVTAGTGSGMRLWNSDSYVASFNTCYATGSGMAFEAVGGDSVTVYNNVFVANTGLAFRLTTYNFDVTSDHNDILSIAGANTASWNDVLYPELSDWQLATTLDSNSMSIDPQFISSADLHVLADTLDGAGIPVPGIAIDIDGNPRNALTPDVGADEIGANDNDAGIFALLPEMPFARGLQPVKAVIRNYGGNTLEEVTVHWTMNNVAQAPFAFEGDLPSLQQDTVVLGMVDFHLSTSYQFKTWTSLPNGEIDYYNSNDTLTTGTRYPAVSDTITIGGTSPDLATMTAAVTALSLGGVLDSVHFQFRPGTYQAGTNIVPSLAMGCNSPVIFESESDNAADVILNNTSLTNHTVVIDGADGVQFRNLTIRTTVAAYHAVELRNGATCNLFDGCVIEGVTTTSTGTAQAVVYMNGGGNHTNTFTGNSIRKGSYNVFWSGDNTTANTLFENNTFEDAYYTAAYLSYQFSPVVHGNTVTTNSAYTYFSGIVLQYNYGQMRMTANEARLPGKRGVGLAAYNNASSAAARAIVANNYVNIGSGANSYGILINGTHYCNADYNTIRISGGGVSGIGLYSVWSNNQTFRNNIIDNRAGGVAFNVHLNEGVFVSDYNNLLTTGTHLVHFAGTNYTDLAAWQETNRDTASISIDPMFLNDADYQVTSAAVNAVATVIAGVNDDIEGELRDTLTPDMGCDEFYLATDDVGIISISYPKEPFPSGENTVFIKFVNNGQDTLVSMQVDWEVDGIPQPTYLWTGLLPSAATYDSLDIGVYNFTAYEMHSIKAWVSLPNGVEDGLAFNDTLEVDSLYPALLGTYTIGGTDPDFDSIGIAVNHLNLGGAAGPVTFNIRTGTYVETINLIDFPGSDCDVPVIFQAESGDSTDVIINNLGLDDNIVTLNGTDGVTFRHLTMQSLNPAYRNVLEFYNGAHCNAVSQCVLIGYEGNSSNQQDAVVRSLTHLDTANVIDRNVIRFGSMGVYLAGNSQLSFASMTGNHFDRNYSHGVYLTQEGSVTVSDNRFSSGGNVFYNGIYIEYSPGANIIERNDLQTNGWYVIRLEVCVAGTERGRIANNFIASTSTLNVTALQVNNSKRYDIVFNNIYVDGNNGSTGMYLHSDSACYVANNIIAIPNTGSIMQVYNQAAYTSDYNDWYTEAGFGNWHGTWLPDLDAWQTTTGQDAHSLDINPQFMSPGNLHVTSILLNGTGIAVPGVTTDFDGDVRNSPPDIGADEFVPSIANDAGVAMYNGPVAPFAHGNQGVQVVIKNLGYETLNTVDVRWVINGIEQPVYHWSGALGAALCDTITIGVYNFAEYTDHDMIFWTETPNGVPDSTHVNDTLIVENVFPALSGAYTIGGILPDFNLFSEVETALNLGGILSDVTFNIRSGTYSAQFKVLDFPRTSYAHKVIFQSEALDSASVTIRRDFQAPGKNYTVLLEDAHNIEIRHLTLASTHGRVVELSDGSSRVNIHNNRLTGVNISYYTSSHQLIYSGSTTEDSVSIVHNRFEEGDISVMLQGSGGDLEKEYTISDNLFIGFDYYALYLHNQDRLLVHHNTVLHDIPDAPYGGIWIAASANTRGITANDIRLKAGGQLGLYLYGVSGTLASPAPIANNYIYLAGSNGGNGLYHGAGNHNRIAYNSVRVLNTNANAFADDGSPNNIHLSNNIFSNEGGGLAFWAWWYTGYNTNTMDYCNLYTNGPSLANYGGYYNNLAALQAGSGQNLHSVSAEPLFGETDPEVYQAACNGTGTPVAGITTDIYGNARHASAPDMGAVEFTLLAHDIGAKLLSAPETYCGLENDEAITIRVQNYGASAESGFDVAYSLDGSAWHVENVGGLTVTPGGTADFTFVPTADLSEVGTYTFALRTQLNTDLNVSNDTVWNINVEHIPALVNPVSNMIPTHGETDLETSISLSWVPAPNATRYDVYVWPEGESQPAEPQVSDITQINTLYNALNYGTTYHWRVNAQNICDQTAVGPVQQFTVRTLPDIVVDTVIAPPNALSGETIQIEWQVKNNGPGSTQSQLWSDAVFLSTDATLNTSFDTYIGAVQNLTALDDDEAYTNTGLFTIPNGFSGNYYVFVYSDRWNNLIESQNNNNWDRTPTPTMITLAPTPDIKVMSVVGPITTFSGQTIPVTAVIKNIGTGDAPATPWHDRIYFGSDPLNYVAGIHMGTVVHHGGLDIDSSYTINTNINVPVGIFGEYYVYVVSDFNNVIFENAAETNNVGISDTIDVILTPPADLFAIDLLFPDTIHNNQFTSLNYTVLNQGGSATPGSSWYDYIYISQAPVYNVNFLTHVTYVNNYGPYAINDSILRVGNYTMPAHLSGDYYYYVHLDKGSQVFEHTLEGNNIVRSAGTFTVVNPDLRVHDVTHPATATSGTNVTVSWDLINDGPGHMYNRGWQYKVYMSASAILNPATATLLKTFYASTPFTAAGDTLVHETVVTIPNGLSGPWYFHVVADVTGAIFEDGNEADNTGTSATPMNVTLPPFPDLKSREIVVPDTVVAGNLFALSYEAYNAGTAAAGSVTIDSFFLSFSPTWNPVSNKKLGRNTGVPAFGISDSMAFTPTLAISSQQTSNVYYIYIKSDATGLVYEHSGESNNILRSAPFFISPAPAVDLHIDTVVSALTANSGTILPVTWTVRNQSQTAASLAGWQDALYLSVDSILDRDLDLRFYETESGAGGLGHNAVYTKQAAAFIPHGLSGNYYLIANADDRQINFDTDTADNARSVMVNQVSTPVNILLSPSPDLTPQLFSAPTSAYSGQPFTITWSVINNGNAPASYWLDKIYISTDATISHGDVLLSTEARGAVALAPGATFTDTITAFVNAQFQGNYILILKTDADNGIYEHLGEGNNQITRSIAFVPPPPSDLLVTSILVPDSTFAGNTISISWNTRNDGTHPTNGLLREIVYLSADDSLDVDDQLFGLVDESLYLPPGSSVPRSMTAAVSGVANGDFYALVQTDARDNINESNDDNNIGVSVDLMNVAIEQLFLDSLTYDSLYNGKEHYFRLEIPLSVQGQNLRVTLDGDALGLYTEVYLKYGNVPTLSDHDQKHLYPYAQDQELLFENLQAGDYYLMVKGHTGHADGQLVTILARIIDFELLSITPDRAGNNGQATIELLGTQMDTLRRVYLVRDTSYVTEAVPPVTSYPSLFVIGSHQEWELNDNSSVLTAVNSDNIYRGYVYLPEDTNYMLFSTMASGIPFYGDNEADGDLELNGDTIVIPYSGYFNVEVNLNTSVYTFVETYWNATGTALGATVSEAMSYDIEEGYWRIRTDMVAGEFVFRANLEGDLSFGDTGNDSVLDDGGVGIQIPAEGNYTIHLYLNQANPTYSIAFTSDDRIAADTITEINSQRAFATFQLDGVPPGMYTVQAMRYDGKMAQLIDAFEVIEGGEEGDLQIIMDYPGVVGRINGPMKITVYYQNAGDQDLVNQSFRFEAPWGNLLAYSYEDLRNGITSTYLDVPIQGAFGPAGVLPPKAANVIELFAWSHPHPTFALTPNND